jgi:hypothetical protein
MAQVTLFWMISLLRPLLAIQKDMSQQYTKEYGRSFIEGDWTKDWCIEDNYPTGLFKIPMVYIKAGGDLPRSPGQYDDNNIGDLGYIATDTCEYIHSSVRMRWDKDEPAYPRSLGGFHLRVGKERDEDRSGWEWYKTLADGRELVIPEWMFRETEAVVARKQDLGSDELLIMRTLMADPRR